MHVSSSSPNVVLDRRDASLDLNRDKSLSMNIKLGASHCLLLPFHSILSGMATDSDFLFVCSPAFIL